MNDRPIKILLVEDHAIVREGLKLMLEEAGCTGSPGGLLLLSH